MSDFVSLHSILFLAMTISLLFACFTSILFSRMKWFVQVGNHGIIIEFTNPDYNIRRNATYLPEVTTQEGNYHLFSLSLKENIVNLICLRFSRTCQTSWAARWTHWILSLGWIIIETINLWICKVGYDGPISESLRKWIQKFYSRLYYLLCSIMNM